MYIYYCGIKIFYISNAFTVFISLFAYTIKIECYYYYVNGLRFMNSSLKLPNVFTTKFVCMHYQITYFDLIELNLRR